MKRLCPPTDTGSVDVTRGDEDVEVGVTTQVVVSTNEPLEIELQPEAFPQLAPTSTFTDEPTAVVIATATPFPTIEIVSGVPETDEPARPVDPDIEPTETKVLTVATVLALTPMPTYSPTSIHTSTPTNTPTTLIPTPTSTDTSTPRPPTDTPKPPTNTPTPTSTEQPPTATWSLHHQRASAVAQFRVEGQYHNQA